MTYNIGMISLGCEKNRVDAEILLGNIKSDKYNIVSKIEDADAVIVNTCGFIQSAKEESIDEILKLVKTKKDKNEKLKYVIVTGCLAERYKKSLSEEIPEIDGIVGIGSNAEIKNILDKVFDNEKISIFGNKSLMPLSGKRVLTTPSYYAYLKVADGCDNFCSYCAIPMIRGRFRSRPKEEIINEAKQLVDSGVRELLVIAQDTTRYGEDLYGKFELPNLLRMLCKIEGLHWIRLMYCYPERITDELLDVMAEEKKILNYIDLPLQHCNENILKLMNREGNRKSLEELIKKMRCKMPNLTLRTTFICGFPGEGENEFKELVDFVSNVKFDKLGCFAYSREEGTRAFNMGNQVRDKIKEQRCKRLMKLQKKIYEENAQKLLNKTIEVLVEGFDGNTGFYFGRSGSESPDVDGKVVFVRENNDNLDLSGEFVSVRISGYSEYDLIGVMEE